MVNTKPLLTPQTVGLVYTRFPWIGTESKLRRKDSISHH